MANTKPKLFISYSWQKETMDDVRKVAEKLKASGKYDVWLDIDNMQADSINTQMAHFVKTADLVLIFFNNYYQARPNCQKEATLSDKYRRNKIFVLVQKPPEQLKLEDWFDAIILDKLYIDFYNVPNADNKILDSVAQHLKQPAPQAAPAAPAPAATTPLEKKETDLFNACCNGDLKTIQALVVNKKEVNLNARYDYRKHGDKIGEYDTWDNGTTPLMFAAGSGQPDAVELLLKQPGILVNAEDDYGGSTALSLALDDGNKRVEEMLRKKGAKDPPKPAVDEDVSEAIAALGVTGAAVVDLVSKLGLGSKGRSGDNEEGEGEDDDDEEEGE